MNVLARYPVLILDVVKIAAAILGALGYVTIPVGGIADVAGGLGIVVPGVLALVTHLMVTPLAAPRNAAGTPLIPAYAAPVKP